MTKVIPPVLFLICIVLMISVHQLYPIGYYLRMPLTLLGVVPLLIGFIMTITVRRQFAKAKTEIHTFKEPDQLVTQGLFRISRNPIYLGFALSLAGVGLLLGSYSPLLIIVAFVLVTHYGYIPYEEKVMKRVFGQEYVDYQAKVRRWI